MNKALLALDKIFFVAGLYIPRTNAESAPSGGGRGGEYRDRLAAGPRTHTPWGPLKGYRRPSRAL